MYPLKQVHLLCSPHLPLRQGRSQDGVHVVPVESKTQPNLQEQTFGAVHSPLTHPL